MIPCQTTTPAQSQLHIIIQQLDLLARLECRQADIRTSITPERIAQRAIATAADLALHSEVELVEIVSPELHRLQVLVRRRALRRVFCCELLS